MKRKYTFDDAQKGIKGTPYVPTEAEKDEAVKLYFSDMAGRYEQHKATGGDVFNFEPNREQPINARSTALIEPASLPGDDLYPGQDEQQTPQP